MNGKISSGQVLSIEVGLIVALFPGLVNTLILNMAKNASLLSILIATIIGFIPILMIVFISKRINNKSLKNYLIDSFGILGHILNFVLITIAIFIIFISSWLTIDFIISQFLTRTSYYFITIILSLIIAWTINKGIETTSKSIFILFIFTIIVMIVLWTTLIPYIDLDNLKPYVNVSSKEILKSSILYLTYTTLPIIYILDLKNITNDKNNFERKIVISYLISSVIIMIFIFLIISIYTIDLATILTYPVYSLFKKTQILGFVERIENFAAIQIIVAFYIQVTYLIYYVKNNINSYLNLKKRNSSILTYIIALLIPIASIVFFKNHNLNNYIYLFPYILSFLFIIIAFTFIFSLKKKKS